MRKTCQRAVQTAVAMMCAAVWLACIVRPAQADDVLHILGASNAAGAFEVLDHVADLGGYY